MIIRSLVLGVLVWAFASKGGMAGVMTGGATEWTQILNNIQLVELAGSNVEQVAQNAQQIAHQITQIENQLNQYRAMLQNLERLPDPVWGRAVQDLNDLQRLVMRGEGIAFSLGGLDDVLAQRFPSLAAFEDALSQGERFSDQYAQWSQTNRDTIGSTLAAAGLTARQFATEAQTTAQLQAQSRSAVGQMQALQIGHAIAGQQVEQLQKLRGLIAQQTVMLGTWYQSRQSQSDLAQARRDHFFTVTLPALDGRTMQIRR